jgi:hypothetical protein
MEDKLYVILGSHACRTAIVDRVLPELAPATA